MVIFNVFNNWKEVYNINLYNGKKSHIYLQGGTIKFSS